jgi:hypothetical protein
LNSFSIIFHASTGHVEDHAEPLITFYNRINPTSKLTKSKIPDPASILTASKSSFGKIKKLESLTIIPNQQKSPLVLIKM